MPFGQRDFRAVSYTHLPEDYKINVEALEKVQPKDLTASEIFVQLGTTWLPEEIAQQFMYEFLDVYKRQEYTDDVIESLENTFGELENLSLIHI